MQRQIWLSNNNETVNSSDPGLNGAGQVNAFINNEGVVERAQTVQFVEDAEVEVNDFTNPFEGNFLSAATDKLKNDVTGFLERPLLFNQFVWAPADVQATQKLTASFPGALLSDVMYREKIAGFRYFRATLVVRMQVNSQPFNAGRLLMIFVPFNNSYTTLPSNLQHLSGITGFRRVELDVGQSTSAEFRIPYMSPLTHTDLITGFGEMGDVKIFVYSPLSGGTNSVEVSMWGHFENVELQMPTGEPLHNFTRIQAQGLESEKKKGDVQTLFEAQTRILDRIGKVPVVADAASGLRWFTDAASRVAGAFGWSRPTDPSFETPMSIRNLRNFANYNGNSLAKPMGLDARNSVLVPAGQFSSDEDEMSLAKIVNKPVYLDTMYYLSASAPGTVIWKWPVHPSACNFLGSTESVIVRNNTYLSYLSNLFEFWRGGINYHFKAIKSAFHSGRLRFVFVPGATMDTDLATVNREKCYTQVVDLRTTADFEFTIPFVSNRLWDRIVDFPPAFGDFTTGVPTGLLFAEVLNTLQYGGSAADRIQILVETSGAEDFQFAFPKRGKFVQYPPAPAPRIVAQMKFFEGPAVPGLNANVASMGEAVFSLRQLLKRYTPMSSVSTGTITPGNGVLVFPYSESTNDTYGYISKLYAMRSGGIRLMFEQADQDALVAFNTFQIRPFSPDEPMGPVSVTFTGPVDETSGLGLVKTYFPLEGFVELDIPWYQPVPALPTMVGQPAPRSYESTDSSKVPNNAGTAIAFNKGDFLISRVIGEDFSFGYLIGPPRTVFNLD